MRVLEPAAGTTVLTGDGRLFVPVELEDLTGRVELRMREKAVLELSGVDSRETFCSEVRAAGLSNVMRDALLLSTQKLRNHTVLPNI